jgi:thiol-disulfide isomerase/thioredoxin
MLKTRTALAFVASAALGATTLLMFGASADMSMDDRVVSLDKRVQALESELTAMTAKMTRNHPDQKMEQAAVQELSTINAMITSGKAAEAKPALVKFMDQYGATKAAARAQSLSQDLVSVGKAIPANWQVDDWYQGSTADLTSANTTVVVFWETWCPHCRRALPSLQNVYDQYRSKGLNVVGVTKLSRSSTEQAVRDFITENKIGYAMGKENGALSSYFGVSSIPSSVVIQNGVVVWSGHPAAINGGMVESWLGNNAS